MTKLPKISGKEIINILIKKQGFVVKRQKGSHVTLYKLHYDGTGLYVTVPIHGNKDLLPKTLFSILRQAKIEREELINLL